MNFDGWYMRVATPDDAGSVLAIYTPYVLGTVVTFECDVPGLEDFRLRIARTLERYPYLVACSADGVILGYCYAGSFKPRKAYDWSVESSIYLSPEAQGHGISGELYGWLEELLVEQGITNMNACIAVPNPGSTAFHAKRGFREVARFTQCGYKLGTWQDMIWMEKFIAAHPAHPEPVVDFADLPCARERFPRIPQAV